MPYRLYIAALALLFPLATHAQGASPATDTVYLRAQQLVADGNGDAGRALVAARLEAARPGSPEYVEALFWRAALASAAVEAEGDYRRIIVEHPTSPRAEDALTRLAQLELARGRHEEALRHLERLAREYPSSPSRARTQYWMARVLLDGDQVARGCARLADARVAAPAEDAELRNQIDYHAQRCVGVDTMAAAAAAPAPAPSRRQPAPAAAPARQTPAPAQRPPSTAAGRTGWTVQVAAVATRQAAVEIQERMRARGHDARVVQIGNLWRVRVGRFASREQATTLSERMRTQRIDNFVTEGEPR